MSPPMGSIRISKVSVRIEIRSSVLVVSAALGLLTAATVGVSDALPVIISGALVGISLGRSLPAWEPLCALGIYGISTRDELPSSMVGGKSSCHCNNIK